MGCLNEFPWITSNHFSFCILNIPQTVLVFFVHSLNLMLCLRSYAASILCAPLTVTNNHCRGLQYLKGKYLILHMCPLRDDRIEDLVCVYIHMCMLIQSCLTLCNSMDCSPPGSSVHVHSRKEYWSGFHSLLQGIFLIQGSNLGLHCR